MIVIIPERSGFCPGVKNAEKNIFKLKERLATLPLFVYGFLINNKKYIEYLKAQDINTSESIDLIPKGATVAIRTHGLDRVEEALLRTRFDVVDLTCVCVKKVQHEIEQRARNGCFTIIVGVKNHPEVKGLVSYASAYTVIENEEDLEVFLESRTVPGRGNDRKKYFLCAQTTGSHELFDKVLSRLRTTFPDEAEIEVYDSICPATDNKENEALLLQRAVDISFVVGDRISSNAKKLFRILSSGTDKLVYFIEDLGELRSLRLPLEKFSKALVVSSASTPLFIEKEIKTYLESINKIAAIEK